MWTKLGDEFSDEARELSDAAFRTHVEALCWSNRRLLDLAIEKRDLKRFAETGTPDAAVEELIDAGWWQDCGDAWYVGTRFSEWQRDRSQVEHRREQQALAQKRRRRHLVGDHSLCLSCPKPDESTDDSSNESGGEYVDDPGRVGSGRVGDLTTQRREELLARAQARDEELRASNADPERTPAKPSERCDRCDNTETKVIGAYRLCRLHAGARWNAA
jgi:hypothetical protein